MKTRNNKIEKMGRSLFVIFLIHLFSFGCDADLDKTFCEQYMEKDKGFSNAIQPIFPKTFVVHTEQTQINESKVENFEMGYYDHFSLFHIKVKGFKNGTELWFDIPNDAARTRTFQYDGDDNKVCVTETIDQSHFGTFLHVISKKNGTRISLPSEILRYKTEAAADLRYVGPSQTRANIPTERYQACQYVAQIQKTAVVTFDFASKDVKKAGVSGALLSQSIVTKLDFLDLYYRYDYANMDLLRYEQINSMDPPTDTFCKKEKPTNRMLSLSDNFRLFVERVLIESPDEEIPKVSILSQVIHYFDHYKLFYNDIILPQGGGFDATQRVVHDQRLGVDYIMDLDAMICLSYPSSQHQSFVGKTILDDPNFFLHLHLPFEYHGQILYKFRNIDVDVYVAKNKKGQTITWYLATPEWMVNAVGFSAYEPFPVALEVKTPATEKEGPKTNQFNFFEYSPHLPYEFPDYSDCFDSTDSLHINMLISGARYDQAYIGHAESFINEFSITLMKQGGFSLATRINRLSIQPLQNDKIFIHFILLGNPKTPDGADVAKAKNPSSMEIFKKLQDSVYSKSFVFHLKNEERTIISRLVAIDIMNYQPEDLVDDASQLSSAGYKAGSMAGIGIGLLVTGILLGIVVIFAFSKFRENRTSDVGMKTLKEETDT